MRAGTLYIVATPIGNFKDITFRAIDTLEKVDIIAAEDTRHTRLLVPFPDQIQAISCHEHNEMESAWGILEFLKAGMSIALVSDAGTPTISDPGYRLVNAAIAENTSGSDSGRISRHYRSKRIRLAVGCLLFYRFSAFQKIKTPGAPKNWQNSLRPLFFMNPPAGSSRFWRT